MLERTPRAHARWHARDASCSIERTETVREFRRERGGSLGEPDGAGAPTVRRCPGNAHGSASRSAARRAAPGSSSSAQSFSSLTRRIVFLNVAGLLALVARHSLSIAIPRRPDRGARAEACSSRARSSRTRSPTSAAVETATWPSIPNALLDLQAGTIYGTDDGTHRS